MAAFSNSFAGPFVFDDEAAILENPTIRHLWPIWKTLCPPNDGETVSGRPLLNLSLARQLRRQRLERVELPCGEPGHSRLGGPAVVRHRCGGRSCCRRMRDRWAAAATPLALAIALLWAVHPLQTESVTYIVQRAESLVGLFYLLTLYCFIRGADSARAASLVRRCGAGLPAGHGQQGGHGFRPADVLLYDRTFLAGSFREAWRRRWGLYLALAGTWLLLGWLVVSTGNRGGTAGFGVGISCVGVSLHAVRGDRSLPAALRLAAPAGARLRHRHRAERAGNRALRGRGRAARLGHGRGVWRWPKVGFLGHGSLRFWPRRPASFRW